MARQQPTFDQIAALADVILDLAHQLDPQNPRLRGVLPLTGTEMAVMREIHRTPRLTPSQLAEITGLQKSNLSTALRALVAGGLVVREQFPGDARSITLAPTARAAESISRINTFWVDQLTRAPAESLAEAATALDALMRIATSLREAGA